MVIARKLLRSFGGKARVEMWTADVLSEVYPRLARALDDVKPTLPLKLFGLARLQMQRVPLDCVRAISGGGVEPSPKVTPLFPAHEPSGGDEKRLIDLMLDLVAAIESLSDKQAETAWLKLAGFTHREIAEFLGVHHDTVDVYWSKACVPLSKHLAAFMGTR